MKRAISKKIVPEQNISNELFWAWKKHLRYGDGEAIRRKTNFDRKAIDNAIKYGYVTVQQGLSDAITAFFEDRILAEKRDAEKLESLAN